MGKERRSGNAQARSNGKICHCSVAIQRRAWSMSHGATSAGGGMVVPLAPAKGPEATREVMEGDRSWHEAGESCATILLCTCCGEHQCCSPKGDPEHPQPWAKQGGEEPWSRQGTLTSLAAPARPRILLLLKRARNCLILPALPARDDISVCRRKEQCALNQQLPREWFVFMCLPSSHWPLCPGCEQGGLHMGL